VASHQHDNDALDAARASSKVGRRIVIRRADLDALLDASRVEGPEPLTLSIKGTLTATETPDTARAS
jgi:hypothetical protein